MKDRPLGHLGAQHLLQAQGLTAKLEVRGAVPAGRPVLVLHRVGGVPVVLDQVGFSHESQGHGPEGNAVLPPHAGDCVPSRLVHPVMDGIPLQREDILVVGLLPVNQGALPGAVGVMLKADSRTAFSRSGIAGIILAPPVSPASGGGWPF